MRPIFSTDGENIFVTTDEGMFLCDEVDPLSRLVVIADRDHENVAMFSVIFDGEIVAANKTWRNVFATVTEYTGNVEATECILRAALYEFDSDKSDDDEITPHDIEWLCSVIAHAAGSVQTGWCRDCHDLRQQAIEEEAERIIVQAFR